MLKNVEGFIYIRHDSSIILFTYRGRWGSIPPASYNIMQKALLHKR